jgi:hypothetical protein
MMISTRRFVLPDARLQRNLDLGILNLLVVVDFGEAGFTPFNHRKSGSNGFSLKNKSGGVFYMSAYK